MNKEKFHEIGMEVLQRKIRERVILLTTIILGELDNEYIKEYIFNTSKTALDHVDNTEELNNDPAVKAMILDDVKKSTGIEIIKIVMQKIEEDYNEKHNDIEYQKKRLEYADSKIKNISEDDLSEEANKELKEFLKNYARS